MITLDVLNSRHLLVSWHTFISLRRKGNLCAVDVMCLLLLMYYWNALHNWSPRRFTNFFCASLLVSSFQEVPSGLWKLVNGHVSLLIFLSILNSACDALILVSLPWFVFCLNKFWAAFCQWSSLKFAPYFLKW